MNLKESFRYQNYLSELFDTASSRLDCSSVCLEYTYHHKSKSNPDAEDIDEVKNPDELNPQNLIDFLFMIIEEREKLGSAIAKAKASASCNIDVAVETNKCRRDMINCLKDVLKYKEGKRVDYGTAYKFNATGDQVPYRYEIEIESKEKFVRDTVKKTYRKMLSIAETTSTSVDEVLINTKVEYVPPFFVDDSFDEVFASFAKEEE